MRKLYYIVMFIVLSAVSYCSSASTFVSSKFPSASAAELTAQRQDMQRGLILEKKADSKSMLAAHYSHSSHGSHSSHASHFSHYSSRY